MAPTHGELNGNQGITSFRIKSGSRVFVLEEKTHEWEQSLI